MKKSLKVNEMEPMPGFEPGTDGLRNRFYIRLLEIRAGDLFRSESITYRELCNFKMVLFRVSKPPAKATKPNPNWMSPKQKGKL